MAYWEKINSIKDLKALSLKELNSYAEEVRAHIIETVEKNGGHLASNLGTVELTLALDYVFDVPNDKIVWDVGHQSYTHKIVTGRRDSFDSLRQNGLLYRRAQLNLIIRRARSCASKKSERTEL